MYSVRFIDSRTNLPILEQILDKDFDKALEKFLKIKNLIKMNLDTFKIVEIIER